MLTDITVIAGRECRVIRSERRKTVCIRVAGDGVPELLVPTFITDMELRHIAGRYAGWIDEHAKSFEELMESRGDFELRIGDTVRCLGNRKAIRAHPEMTVSYDDEAFYVPEGFEEENLRRAVIQAYKLFARNYLTARTYEIARMMGLKPSAVKVNSAKTRWGSCSSRGSVNYTWYAVMADREAADYIIIHELCHMRHMNHSKAFWAEVRKWCPEYERMKDELKEVWREIQGERWE